MNISLKIKNINKNNFKKYGEIISIKDNKYTLINNNFYKKFQDLANIQTSKINGKTQFNIFKSKARSFPMKIDLLEKHPLGTQAFFPINNCNFIVVVAPIKQVPQIDKIEAFLVPKNTGINYKIGIWHYPLISIINSTFIVLDRKGPKKNLEIYKFKKNKIILNYEHKFS